MSDDPQTQPDTAQDAEAVDGEGTEQDSSVLSDAEVGALLDGVADGVVPTGGGLGRSGEVHEYTYSDNAHVSSYCPASLVNLYQRLRRCILEDLRQIVRADVTIELEALRRHRYEDYVASVNEPASVNVISEPSLPGAGLMVFDAPLIGTLVDCYYGGGASDSERDVRALTPVELRMATMCVNGFLGYLNTIWSNVTPVAFATRTSDTNPRLVTVTGQSDWVLVARYAVTIGEKTGEFHLVKPLSMIAPMRAALAAIGQGKLAARPGFVTQMRDHLRNVPVDLAGTLCEFEMSLRDVIAMQPGDILPLDLPPHAVLRVDGADVLHGRFGRSRGINAISVAYREINNQPAEDAR